MKKKMFSLIIACVLLIPTSLSLAVDDFGPFTYWYADTHEIGYYGASSIKVAYAKTAGFGMSDSTFTTVGDYGVDTWKTTTNRTRTTGTVSDYHTLYFGISRAESNNFGFPSNVLGVANIENRTHIASGTYGGVSKKVYSVGKAVIYLVWDTSSGNTKTSSFSTDKWKAIAAHEFGHSAGYFGHDSSTSSLMYFDILFFDVHGTNSPKTRDVTHLSQVY